MAQEFNSQDSKREFDRYRKKVARLNDYINEVIKKCGSHEVYLDKSSTIISAPAEVWPIEEVKPNGPGCELLDFPNEPEKELVFRQKYVWPEYSANGTSHREEYTVIKFRWEYDAEADEWFVAYYGDGYDFEDDLRYTKKCVRCGLRYWESEDPDRFLEKDDDDEEGGEA